MFFGVLSDFLLSSVSSSVLFFFETPLDLKLSFLFLFDFFSTFLLSVTSLVGGSTGCETGFSSFLPLELDLRFLVSVGTTYSNILSILGFLGLLDDLLLSDVSFVDVLLAEVSFVEVLLADASFSDVLLADASFEDNLLPDFLFLDLFPHLI